MTFVHSKRSSTSRQRKRVALFAAIACVSVAVSTSAFALSIETCPVDEGCHHSIGSVLGGLAIFGAGAVAALLTRAIPDSLALALFEAPFLYLAYRIYQQAGLVPATIGIFGSQIFVLALLSVRDPHREGNYFSFLKATSNDPEEAGNSTSSREQPPAAPTAVPNISQYRAIREKNSRAIHGRADLPATEETSNGRAEANSQLFERESLIHLNRLGRDLPGTPGYAVLCGRSQIRFVVIYGECLRETFDAFIAWAATAAVRDSGWVKFTSHGFSETHIARIVGAADQIDASNSAAKEFARLNRIKPGSARQWPPTEAKHVSRS